MKEKNFYNKNQFVIYGDDEIIFQSYDSVIAIINTRENTLKLGRNWDYSKTTLNHLYLFLNEFIFNNIEIYEALRKNNKKQAIQKLIDNGYIEYDENLI